MKTYALRLTLGDDLKQSIEKYFEEKNTTAGVILTCVGSVYQLKVRLPDGRSEYLLRENLEIVSLVGTYSKDGAHLHISCSDIDGKVVGGHLKDGTLINTTAELVLGELTELEFSREFDDETGYDELIVKGIK